jgi:hypothetical protein
VYERIRFRYPQARPGAVPLVPVIAADVNEVETLIRVEHCADCRIDTAARRCGKFGMAPFILLINRLGAGETSASSGLVADT